MLGLYIHRDSPIHALPAWIKLLTMVAAGVALFLIDDIALLLAAAIPAATGFVVARLPARAILRQARAVLPFLIIIFAFHAIVTDPLAGATVVVRITLLVLLAILVTLTTRASDMIDCLEAGLRPLAPLGVNPVKVSFVLSLTIRLIPTLFDIVREVVEAQRARGLHRNPVAVVLPVFIRSLRLGDELADALNARGFEQD